MDGSTTNDTAIGEGGIFLTTGHSGNPTIHHSYAISPLNVRIVSYKPISPATHHKPPPVIPTKSADESDILNLLATFHDEGHQIAFTCCPSDCGVEGNEMADEQVRKGAAANQKDVRHNYESEKATIRHATRWGEVSHERICRVFGMKCEKLERRVESKLLRKEQTTMGRLRSGHHPEFKYWQHKVGGTEDTICGKCRFGEETAEHVVYDCPRIHHPPHEPTPPVTLAKDPKKF